MARRGVLRAGVNKITHVWPAADAVFYHGPELCANKMIKERSGHVRRARDGQLAVVMSMESAANYNCLDDPAFMAEFDFEMTYRQDVRSRP